MPTKADRRDPVQPLMFGYTRASTDEQVNGFGLDAQRDAVDQEANRRRWIVKHFADEGVSGKTIGPKLREVLQLLASGQGDGLVVAKLDRQVDHSQDAAVGRRDLHAGTGTAIANRTEVSY